MTDSQVVVPEQAGAPDAAAQRAPAADPPAAAPTSTALPGVDPDAAVDTDAILIRLGTNRFAVDLASIAEVGRVPAITRVPGMPGWLSGVANWRGRILPVLDLRPLIGAESSELDGHSRLLVLTSGGVAVGMVVDLVEGTTSLADVAPFPPASAPAGPQLLNGQLPRAEGPIAVLDADAVLRLRDGLPRGRRSA
ncbi:MAG TPA: chemotaxis protein CheW [Mycobacteriales bacterium]|nr:chemotaxis protein CheW [Mycobacteriales bacterium]